MACKKSRLKRLLRVKDMHVFVGEPAYLCGLEERRLKLFGRKIPDTLKGLNLDEIAVWLQGVEKVGEFKYYCFALGANKPTESKSVKGQPVREVLDFLNIHFMESVNSYVEVQKKAFRSGKYQVIVREIAVTGSASEITKIAVLNYRKST